MSYDYDIGEEKDLTPEEKLELIREAERRRKRIAAICTVIIIVVLAFLPSVLNFIAKIISFFAG